MHTYTKYICLVYYRKEKRVFETYKVEALAARNKKDKEDVENLRREVRFYSVALCG